MLDYSAIIDFNKYTLALGAAGFVYVLDNYSEPKEEWLFWGVVAILFLFLISTLFGILLSAIATKQLHWEKQEKSNQGGPVTDKSKTLNLDRWIERVGTTHSLTLVAAMILLGVVVFSQFVYPEPGHEPKEKGSCCCNACK